MPSLASFAPRAARTALLLGLGFASAAACAGPAGTELLCGMRSGDATSTLRVAAGTDPLAAASVEVGEGFEVRAVALHDTVRADQVARVVITVLDRVAAGRRVVLSQSRLSAVGREILDQQAAWRPNLSGWARVYSPALGRELAWGCALVEKGSSPAGWDRVDATNEAEQVLAEQPRPFRASGSTAGVRIAWMGDVMLADGPGRTIARGRDPFAAVMSAMKGADLRIANLECVIATGGKPVAKPWTFRADPRVLSVLRKHVDVVSLANNHSGDFGPAAFAQMLGRLDQTGLPYFGGGTNLRAAHRPAIVERQGVRIALLGYNEMFPRQFEAGPASPGIAWADEEQIVADIRAARTQADVVIPYMHWGQEHSESAHARQRALARLMIGAGAGAGADAVVGTHPHVRQDIEVIDGKPVIYSLGNFVFDGFDDADNNTGSLLWMTVTSSGVKDWHLEPVHIDSSGSPLIDPKDAARSTRQIAADRPQQSLAP
ncbi:CapA family protein [Roseateles sp.]|uniref:CapA family protein n=1 Tax=Roseateles sp. TaxID=1971397 RepID=UPI0032643C7A